MAGPVYREKENIVKHPSIQIEKSFKEIQKRE